MSGIITLALLAALLVWGIGRVGRRMNFPVSRSAVAVIFILVVLALWGSTLS